MFEQYKYRAILQFIWRYMEVGLVGENGVTFGPLWTTVSRLFLAVDRPVIKATERSVSTQRAYNRDVPRPPPRSTSSSDCCRCQWLRPASSTMSTLSIHHHHPGKLPPPPPPPPPILTSSEPASSVTSPSVKNVCGIVPLVPGGGCLLHTKDTHLRTPDLGICPAVTVGDFLYSLRFRFESWVTRAWIQFDETKRS